MRNEGSVKLPSCLAFSKVLCCLSSRKKIIAVVGIANMDPRKVDHTEYPVNMIILHENFNNRSMSNNIALLRTESAIHFDDMVQAICFLDKKQDKAPTLKNCWVAGWNPTAAVNTLLP